MTGPGRLDSRRVTPFVSATPTPLAVLRPRIAFAKNATEPTALSVSSLTCAFHSPSRGNP
jgi:hypothetical protein